MPLACEVNVTSGYLHIAMDDDDFGESFTVRFFAIPLREIAAEMEL